MLYWEKLLHEVQNKDYCHKYIFNPCHEQIVSIAKSERIMYRYFITKDIYLTHREAGCLYYIYKGNTIKATAEFLNLSHRTVEFYLKRVKHKLCCNNRNELMIFLQENEFMVKISGVKF